MGIANGTFDTDLNGWTPTISGNADVIWDSGRARLRVYRCSYATITQDIMINHPNLSFDWETGYDWFPELPKWQLIVSGVPVISENFRICSIPECNGRNSRFSGTNTVDVSTYMGQTATLKFYIDPYPGYCSHPDHANSYLWVDNVQLFGTGIGHLDIHSDPDNAEIYIDGYLLSYRTPTIIDMPNGMYNLRVHKDGYADYTEIIIITTDFTLYRSVTLPPIVTGKGPIDIKSTPPGAKIYIDNVLQPLLTPVMITGIPVGDRYVKLTLASYQDWTATVPVVENTILVIDVTLVQVAIIATSIDVSPGPYIQPSTITITVMWQNTGGSSESFDPAITITKSSDGTTTRMNIGEIITLNPTESTAQIFTVPDLMKDTYTICPDPN